jgi:hypothetical protein
MPWSHEDRLRTEEHIAQARQYISRQQLRIEEMQREGRDTSDAEDLLRTMRQTLVLLVSALAAIKADLESDRNGG